MNPADKIPSSPTTPERGSCSPASAGSVTRADLDAIYQAVMDCDIGDPWDAESGCPRMIPDDAQTAVASFDKAHVASIAAINKALDLVRALYAKVPPNARLDRQEEAR